MVAEEFPHARLVLLLDMAAIVAVTWRERREHQLLGIVLHRTGHRSPGRNVKDRQEEQRSPRRRPLAALVADWIDLHKAWHRVTQSAQVRIGVCDFNKVPGMV